MSDQKKTDIKQYVTIKVKTRLKAGANCCDAEPPLNVASNDGGDGGWGGDDGGGWGGDDGGSDWA